MNKKYLSGRWWKSVLYDRLNVLLAHIGFRPSVRRLSVNGNILNFKISTPLAEVWYGHDNIHSREMEAVTRLFNPSGRTIFEIGSHHGRDCLLLSQFVGSEGKVVSFEPHPENMAVLRENVILNSAMNVITVQAAVGENDGMISIRPHSNAKISVHGSGIPVDMISLDRWAEKNNLWPDILKVDVEGYEFRVLRGARKILSRNPAILLELHCDALADFDDVPDKLWGLIDREHYNIYIQRNDCEDPVEMDRNIQLTGRPHLFFVPRESRMLPPLAEAATN